MIRYSNLFLFTGIVSFFNAEEMTVGAVAGTEGERNHYALASLPFNAKDKVFVKLFGTDMSVHFPQPPPATAAPNHTSSATSAVLETPGVDEVIASASAAIASTAQCIGSSAGTSSRISIPGDELVSLSTLVSDTATATASLTIGQDLKDTNATLPPVVTPVIAPEKGSSFLARIAATVSGKKK